MTSRLLIAVTGLFVCSMSAMADVTWTLKSGYPGALVPGIVFSNGNTATGWFTTDGTGSITAYDVSVTGPTTAADFVATAAGIGTFPPGEVSFADWNLNVYMDLYPGGALPVGGHALALLNGHDSWGDRYGVDCPGCGVIDPASGAALVADNYVRGTDPILTAPEPNASWLLMAMLSAAVLGYAAIGKKRLT